LKGRCILEIIGKSIDPTKIGDKQVDGRAYWHVVTDVRYSISKNERVGVLLIAPVIGYERAVVRTPAGQDFEMSPAYYGAELLLDLAYTILSLRFFRSEIDQDGKEAGRRPIDALPSPLVQDFINSVQELLEGNVRVVRPVVGGFDALAAEHQNAKEEAKMKKAIKKKAAASKASAKKASTKKKVATKKGAPKKKATVKKASTKKKAVVKKATQKKKIVAKKVVAKKAAPKKKAPTKKAKPGSSKAAAKKAVSQKNRSEKAASKKGVKKSKAPAKKVATKKSAAKKAALKRATTKKAAPKKGKPVSKKVKAASRKPKSR